MRVAAISDIHGNLPALEAVLADIAREGIDQVVVAGETSLVRGPLESSTCLASSRAVASSAATARRGSCVAGGEFTLGAWSAARLGDDMALVAAGRSRSSSTSRGSDASRSAMRRRAPTRSIYTRITPDDELASALPASTRTWSCAGTRTSSYDRQLRTASRLVNPGSVGLPYRASTGAFWAMLGPTTSSSDASAYDVEKRARGSFARHRAPVGGGRASASRCAARSADSATRPLRHRDATWRVATSARRGAASGGAASA